MKPLLLLATLLSCILRVDPRHQQETQHRLFLHRRHGLASNQGPLCQFGPRDFAPNPHPIKTPLLVEHLLTDFLITHQLIPLDIDIIYQRCKLGNFTLTQNLTLPV